MLKTTDLGF